VIKLHVAFCFSKSRPLSRHLPPTMLAPAPIDRAYTNQQFIPDTTNSAPAAGFQRTPLWRSAGIGYCSFRTSEASFRVASAKDSR
jgi:hypothetical protein